MSLPRVIPALANLTQDIAGPVPVRLLQDWARGEQDLDTAQTLLNSFRIFGTVVSTDTSGLSKLTKEMDLLDVVQLVSEPKEIVHALGCEVGGRAVGTWVADNTQMYFPTAVNADTVLDAMAEVQCRVRERHPVRLGMCIHSGCFYEMGGGLYGPDADLVEELAENYAGPDEILITETVVNQSKRIGPEELVMRSIMRAAGPVDVFSHRSRRRMEHLPENQTRYPHPFPEDFYRMLALLRLPEQGAQVRKQLYSDWLREAVVVFLARHREQGHLSHLGNLLDDLLANACMDAVVRNGAPASGEIATSGGGIAILTFDNAQYALDYIRALFDELSRNGLPVVAGVDKGPILHFRNLRGRSGISGDPVNIASKLAEDAGCPGEIKITDKASAALAKGGSWRQFELISSGVPLHGYTIV
ncbi:MAG: hypothetical protein SGI92_26320 [Bryobacteraceae bacterium]|nr:hypothetical protein [Bryobacteraceae bacterium]